MNSRLSATQEAISRSIRHIERPKDSLGRCLPISEFFGNLTFGLDEMKEKLTRSAFEHLTNMVDKGQRLPKETADEIAAIVKDWALSQGVTHFCHWFQPMTGLTAEKHDAIMESKTSELGKTRVIERLSGSALIQSEPDASSFPSGGMRTTFEARGYTAWDPTSPLFVMEQTNGKTLCIPSAFVSYSGHALDIKTPLLRSIQALSKESIRFLKLLGDLDVHQVHVTLGVEQEYFLIDRSFFSLRPDLVMTGRSLLGRASTRGQQFEDHYFGSIPSRILAFMHELEQEMYRLGVPLKTRHNEVAPSQFEVAPIFEHANLSADHNALLMDMLRRVAYRHDLVCLLHEKPFAGINGSGKHNNWSLSTNRGVNLLDPGRTPHQNLRFLAVLSGILKAVHEHSAVLRAGIASAGNDHRLGANEAPPAIMSVFLGDTLSKICERIEKGEIINESPEEAIISLGVSSIPAVARDNTDRNRTSPFAFTGNKFEFRAVGALANVGIPVAFLNAAVADAFRKMSDRLEKLLESSSSRDEAVFSLIRETLLESKAIRFEGNNYSEDWVKEAEKRKLPHLKNSAEAFGVLKDKKQTEFLISSGVLSEPELQARYHINLERYNKHLEMEAATLLEMIDTQVLSAVESELQKRTHLYQSLESLKMSSKTMKKRLDLFMSSYEALLSAREQLQEELKNSFGHAEEEQKKAKHLSEKLFPQMEKLRLICDDIESQVSDELWPLPKYREILFLR
jgi:glutamine synthetase